MARKPPPVPAAANRQRLMAQFNKRLKSAPRGLPRNATARPTEDSALFNPLVHGNRRFGRKFAGRPFTTATKYKGPSGKR